MSGDKSGGGAATAAAVKSGDVKSDGGLNLFRIPHTRMKELVSWPLKGVQDLDVQDLEPSLQVVHSQNRAQRTRLSAQMKSLQPVTVPTY